MPQVIKINAITVPADSGDELARRFAARAGAVDGQDGFEGFELLRPTDDRPVWLVVTRWRDEEAFRGWAEGAAFQRAHGGRAPHAEGSPAGQEGDLHGENAAQPSPEEGAPQRPVGMSAELWSYEVADLTQH
ncbi:antibiotic biosynthesis monooxygenase family protein [Actinomycetota bacterium]|nr:antibiotic biosynthesis monooxygenase [Micrococcales bacterium]